MSLARNGKEMMCDGYGCHATARVPVALRPVLTHKMDQDGLTPKGWLCVSTQGGGRHFCPSCAARFMLKLLNPEHPQGAL